MVYKDAPSMLLFIGYKIVMWLKNERKSGQLDWHEKLWGYPFVLVGFLADVYYNLVYATVRYWDWPQEWLFTSRLQRYKAGPDGWRKERAIKICEELNRYDEGHC